MAARKKEAPVQNGSEASLFQRKRVAVAEEGSWVTGEQVKALGKGALLVRGLSSDLARDAFSAKARMVPANGRAPDRTILPSVHARHTREVLSEVCILDARDLTFSAEQIRTMVLDPGYEALIVACIHACQAVDLLSRENDNTEALSGNS
jgi:hypothetical protein